MGELGRVLIITGIILIGLGLFLNLFGAIPGLGRLPGDIYIKRENFVFFFPITTMIILSIILTFLFRFFR